MYSLVGFKKIVSKKTGEEFYEIYVNFVEKNVTGFCCDKFFVRSSGISGDLLVNSDCEIIFNRYGRIDSIEIL